MAKRLQILSVLCLFWFSSCRDSSKSDDSLFLPKSTGNPLEILLVIGKDLYEGPVGQMLLSELQRPVLGLPQAEPAFKVVQVEPQNFESLLKRSHLVMVVELDTVLDAQTAKNIWARPQRVLSYKGRTPGELMTTIEHKLKVDLVALKRFESELIVSKLAKQKADVGKLQRKWGFEWQLPASFQLSTNLEHVSVYWSRNRKSDQGFIVYERPLISDSQVLGGDIIKARDSICKLYIPGEFKGTYMTTVKEFPPVITPTEISGLYALEARGLWEVHGDKMGGPFVSYSLFDEAKGKILVIEGFVFAPEMRKRNLIFELEAYMHSLKLERAL